MDMTVSCNPEPDPVQQGVVADVLPPTETVKMSAAAYARIEQGPGSESPISLPVVFRLFWPPT